MVRADQDVLDSRRNELCYDREVTLRASGVILKFGVCFAQDLLMPELSLFVHVHERLVLRVVREKDAVHVERAWKLLPPEFQLKLKGFPIREHIDISDVKSEVFATAFKKEPRANKLGHCPAPLLRDLPVQKLFGRHPRKLVGKILGMCHQRGVNAVVDEAKIQVTERNRVTVRGYGKCNQRKCEGRRNLRQAQAEAPAPHSVRVFL